MCINLTRNCVANAIKLGIFPIDRIRNLSNHILCVIFFHPTKFYFAAGVFIFSLSLSALRMDNFLVPAYNELPVKIHAFRINVRKSDFLIDSIFCFVSSLFMFNDIMRLRLARAYRKFWVTVVCISIPYGSNMNIGPCQKDSISMYSMCVSVREFRQYRECYVQKDAIYVVVVRVAQVKFHWILFFQMSCDR